MTDESNLQAQPGAEPFAPPKPSPEEVAAAAAANEAQIKADEEAKAKADADAAAAAIEAEKAARAQADAAAAVPETLAMLKAFVRNNTEWVIHELEMKRVGRTVEERAKNNP